MMSAPSYTCVVLLLCLGAVHADGAQLSDLGISKAKSCEEVEQVKGHDVAEHENKNVLKIGVDNGKTRLWMGRYLMSDLREDDSEHDSRKSSYILNESLRQKWQTRVRQEKREEQKRRHKAHSEKPTYLLQTSQPPPQQPSSRNYNVEKYDGDPRNRNPSWQVLDTSNETLDDRSFWNGHRRDLATPTEPLKHTPGNVHQYSPQPRQGYTRRSHLKSILTSTVQPSLKSRDRDRTDKTSDVPTRRRKSPVTFVTQSSAIFPFIATTQAFNFLTSYDSIPPPTRWPIKIILTKHDQGSNQEMEIISNNNEQKIVQLSQSNSPHRGCDNKSMHSLKPISTDSEKSLIESSIRSHVDDRQENKPTTYSNDRICTEDSHFDDPHIQQQTLPRHTDLNEHTQTANITSDEAVENKIEKSDINKKRKRKRKNKLRRQRKRRKQKIREMGITKATWTTSAQRDQVYTSGSILVNPQAASNLQSVDRTGKLFPLITQVEHGKTTAGVYPLSKKQGADLRSSHSNRDDGPSNPANQPSLMYGETTQRAKYNRRDSPTHGDTTQPLLKTPAYNTISKTQTPSSNDKFSDIFQSRKSNDKHMSTSLQYDRSTQSLGPFGKYKLSKCKEKEDLLQNCLEDITNDSPDNTKQHLPGRTDSVPQRKRARTSSGDRRSVPQVPHSNSVQKNVDTERSTAHISPMLQTRASDRRLMKHTTNLHDSATSSPQTLSMHTETTSLRMPPPSDQLSELSSARQWRDRMKRKQMQSHTAAKEHRSTPKINSDNSEPKADKRKGSLASAFSTPKHSLNPAKSPSSDPSNVDIDKKESGPFIGYKSAYDFLSNQKGAKTPFQNEARREANELNRFMSEGMCQIFGKRYVPTRIGGKCE